MFCFTILMSFQSPSQIPLQLSTQSISASIFRIASNTSKIQRGVASYGDSRLDTAELRHKIAALIEETKELIKPTSEELKLFLTSPNENVTKCHLNHRHPTK